MRCEEILKIRIYNLKSLILQHCEEILKIRKVFVSFNLSGTDFLETRRQILMKLCMHIP